MAILGRGGFVVGGLWWRWRESRTAEGAIDTEARETTEDPPQGGPEVTPAASMTHATHAVVGASSWGIEQQPRNECGDARMSQDFCYITPGHVAGAALPSWTMMTSRIGMVTGIVARREQRLKRQRVYLDTSVNGGYFDPEFALCSTGLIRDIRAGMFAAVVSEIVAAEIGDAPVPVRELYAELLGLGAEDLRIEKAALELADLYQARAGS